MNDVARSPVSGTALLTDGGEMASRIAQRDWSATPLGPSEHWPLPLRTLLAVMLGSNQPMFVAWGPEKIPYRAQATATCSSTGKRASVQIGGVGVPDNTQSHRLADKMAGRQACLNMGAAPASQSRLMKPKTSQTKLLYSPPCLTVVGSVAGLTTRVTDLAREDVVSAHFDLGCDDPGHWSASPVLH